MHLPARAITHELTGLGQLQNPPNDQRNFVRAQYQTALLPTSLGGKRPHSRTHLIAA